MGNIPKQVAGYVHKYGTDYLCLDCPEWNADNLCHLHSNTQLVTISDTCNYWTQGQPEHLVPIGALTATESGLARRVNGAGCKRCEYFNVEKWDCEKVDKDSEGDDPGVIHPDACCNAQSPDKVRGEMTNAALRAFGVYGELYGE